jgi:site-specific recombinase XerD
MDINTIIPKPNDITLLGEQSVAALFPGVRVEVGEFTPTRRPPTLDDLVHAWDSSKAAWLASHESENTRNTYSAAVEAFFKWSAKYPWAVGRVDALGWKEHLAEIGQKPATVNLKLAALSSYFEFAENDYAVMDAEGREIPLHHDPHGQAAANPFGRVKRMQVKETNRRKHLNGEQALALLDAVNQNTLSGKRDFALMRLMLYTGYRNTEARTLKWGNLVFEAGKVFHFWVGKGGKENKEQIAPPAWEAVEAYLRAGSRWDTMQPDDYIFTPLTDMTLRLGKIAPEDWDRNHPLSIKEVGRIVKRYAKRAGLNEKEIHPHTLRHSLAMNMRAVGFKLEEVAEKLHHSNIETTRIYDHQDGSDDVTWQTLQSRFKW